jgi:hydroxymethylglutaryl-CoA reductase
MPNSRLPGFYRKSWQERLTLLAERVHLTPEEIEALRLGGLNPDSADRMIENVVGLYTLPLGVAVNFLVNGREVLVPMAVEEPSVVAGASFMARLAREGGGFIASTSASEMIGQVQILEVSDLPSARLALLEQRERILAEATAADPVLAQLGGGARDLEVRVVPASPAGPFLVVHLVIDTRDAMGANAVNGACEAIAPTLEEITGGRVLLRILSNLADRRLARARCSIPSRALSFEGYSGDTVRDRIIEAYAFAAADPYRAATHNKGILNGIDAVAIATGNDWRAVEAGAHAYAARSGSYSSLSSWGRDAKGNLVGTLEMPLALATVGGFTRVHPLARVALKIMDIHSARELAEVVVSVGLAQNLAALRALATEGIQRGHMTLHARQIALAAGATGDQVERVAAQLVREQAIRLDRAQAILEEIGAARVERGERE